MKGFLALLLIIGIAVATYKIHQNRLDAAVEEAAARARADALNARPAPPKAAKLIVNTVSISRNLEPLHIELFSNLDQRTPADLVVPLEVTRERILDQKSRVDPNESGVYDAGAAAVTAMIDLAEERTKALQVMVEAAGKKGTLDSRNTASSSAAFFAQSTVKRWEEEKRRRKPGVDQLLTRLRNAEREWNQRASPGAHEDSYDVPEIAPVNITADRSAAPVNPLERGTYNKQQVIYPWRRTYYDQNGYPRTYPR